ncbi:GrpE-domain-containing protein [Globomyces pollinis-pini]|nr:GrpE-domain-containing protein [Globomyces pollinis-pini]
MSILSKSLFRTATNSLKLNSKLRPISPFRMYSDAKPDAQSDPEHLAKLVSEKDLLLAEKDHQIAELKDAYMRSVADAENVRARTRKELLEKGDYAIQKFAKDLLSTADILSMALDAVPVAERGENTTHPDLKNLYIGVEMTRKELLKTFAQYGITPYESLDQPFDFNLHTAIFQSPMPGKTPGTVFHVDKTGYKIKDRILRPANVGVVKGDD